MINARVSTSIGKTMEFDFSLEKPLKINRVLVKTLNIRKFLEKPLKISRTSLSYSEVHSRGCRHKLEQPKQCGDGKYRSLVEVIGLCVSSALQGPVYMQ